MEHDESERSGIHSFPDELSMESSRLPEKNVDLKVDSGKETGGGSSDFKKNTEKKDASRETEKEILKKSEVETAEVGEAEKNRTEDKTGVEKNICIGERILQAQAESLLKNRGVPESEDTMSDVDLLRQIENNYGVSFLGTHVQNPLFIINQGIQEQKISKNPGEDLLYKLDDVGIISWCSEHYKDSYFAMFLAMCVLDRHPYSEIYEMAMEIKSCFMSLAEARTKDITEEQLVFKSQFVKVLGIDEYRDDVVVRMQKIEADFLRLPSPKVAGIYLQLLAREFPEIKQFLSEYLFKKIISFRRNPKNNTVIKGCMNALTYLGAADLQFFDNNMIPWFLGEKTEMADYCLAVVLYQMYDMSGCRPFVRHCIEFWGKLRNSPHCTLTALYVCGMLGDQEYIVRDIWIRVLSRIIQEMSEDSGDRNGLLYMRFIPELFRSGERRIGYYKGVIHAFSYMIQNAVRERNWQDEMVLYNVFLLGIMDDFGRCNLKTSSHRKQDMLWIRMFEKIEQKTGNELTALWVGALKSRWMPQTGWKILEQYLAENQNAEGETVERLAFFFYCINRMYGSDRPMIFLEYCVRRGQGSAAVAGKIYERLEREHIHGK